MYVLWIRPSMLWMCPQKPMNPSLGVMNPSPKSYESVSENLWIRPQNLWIRPKKPMNPSPNRLIIIWLSTSYRALYTIYSIYTIILIKRKEPFFIFSHYESVLCRMGGNPLVFGQIRPLKQLANNNFSDCWVCIRWGQIYNFSRISKGFAVCFQRLTFFVLSLFFGAVTFLSEFCPRYVQDMSKKTFLSVQVPSASFLVQKGRSFIRSCVFPTSAFVGEKLRICRETVPVLSVNYTHYLWLSASYARL